MIINLYGKNTMITELLCSNTYKQNLFYYNEYGNIHSHCVVLKPF